jgi:hypothetical protein
MSLDWNGDSIQRRTEDAVKLGMNMTITACLEEAKSLVNVRTGTLQRSLRTTGAKETRDGIEGEWGSFDVDYAFWQEVLPRTRGGKAYLRPSADRHYPSLADNIRRAMGQA